MIYHIVIYSTAKFKIYPAQVGSFLEHLKLEQLGYSSMLCNHLRFSMAAGLMQNAMETTREEIRF